MKGTYGYADSPRMQEWFQNFLRIPLSPKFAVRVKKFHSVFTQTVKEFREVREELFEEYGTEVDGQRVIKENHPKRAEFIKKYEELLNTEIDFECPIVFTEKDLDMLEGLGVKLTGEDITNLEFFGGFKFDEELPKTKPGKNGAHKKKEQEVPIEAEDG